MSVTTQDGKAMVITSVVNTGRVEGTYNLTIADFETYFVGENRILVHNCNKSKGAEHTKNARPSTKAKHEEAESRRNRDQARSTKPKRGNTRADRAAAKKERKKSDAYLKKD